MKTILLTTKTTHHHYFIWKVMEQFSLHSVIVEEKFVSPPFLTQHDFESKRDEFERDVLLEGCSTGFDHFTNTLTFDSINSDECVRYLQIEKPDVILDFGTGLLQPKVFQTARVAALNLHGGNPEKYRGLDTHLWAIYHVDFLNLVTTLHHLAPELDTGRIVLETQLDIPKKTALYELRSINTKVCVNMCLLALRSLMEYEWLPGRQQQNTGRYYSFMPSELKDICVKRFERYTSV